MKSMPTKQDINATEQTVRDTERLCNRDPDNMTGREYRNAILDSLASDGFNVNKVTTAELDAACDFPRE